LPPAIDRLFSKGASETMITGEQVKAARALLGLSQLELAHLAHVSQQSIANVEIGGPDVSDRMLRIIRHALESGGVEFPEGAPPRLKGAQ
jgi:transcriptional regulator with XRE-family HTH domain